MTTQHHDLDRTLNRLYATLTVARLYALLADLFGARSKTQYGTTDYGSLTAQIERIETLVIAAEQNRAALDDPDTDPGAALIYDGMACTTCGKPVFEASHGYWVHKSTDDYMECPVPDGDPIKARVDA